VPVLQDGNRRRRIPLPALHEPALIQLLRRALPVAFLAAGCASPENADARHAQDKQKGRECRISRISDGDSFTCAQSGRVRLLMIDAPELAQGKEGRQAQAALAKLAPVGTIVTLESDVRAEDDYGRSLSYVYLPDGRMVNEEMARLGMVTALVYPPNVKHTDRIRKAVADARREKRGLWSTNFFDCSPRDYRARRC
jgi:micrococcal nuclease